MHHQQMRADLFKLESNHRNTVLLLVPAQTVGYIGKLVPLGLNWNLHATVLRLSHLYVSVELTSGCSWRWWQGTKLRRTAGPRVAARALLWSGTLAFCHATTCNKMAPNVHFHELQQYVLLKTFTFPFPSSVFISYLLVKTTFTLLKQKRTGAASGENKIIILHLQNNALSLLSTNCSQDFFL